MSEMQLINAANFMNKHFFSVYPTEEQTIDEILKKFSYLIRKKNIQTFSRKDCGYRKLVKL
jgi:hypothetical protein